MTENKKRKKKPAKKKAKKKAAFEVSKKVLYKYKRVKKAKRRQPSEKNFKNVRKKFYSATCRFSGKKTRLYI